LSAAPRLPDAPLADPRAAATLAEALRRVAFDPAALATVLAGDGNEEDPTLFETRAARLPPALAAAMRLFILGTQITRAEAEAALTPAGVEAGMALRVVVGTADGVRATVRIVPHDVVLLASDLPAREPPAEHVAAAHRPSLTLARLTVRRRVERALDLGTGNGIQALLLARHADLVVATDVNERALRFTDLNASLNARPNIETRAGSFFEPVEGERFGVAVCNPPYVISPESRLLYRDADVRGDVLSENLVRELPGYLEDGAFATVLVSWVADTAEADSPPVRWSAGGGCDALVFELERQSALESATHWHRGNDTAAAGKRLANWLDFYRRESIEEIGYGALVLRRRDGQTWQDVLSLEGGPAGHASDQLLRMFAARDALARAPVHQQRFALAPDAILQRGALVLRGGLGLRAELDPAAGAVVERLSGARTAGTAFDAAARALGRNRAEMRELGEELVSRLVELGFLVAAADSL
jgi:methylase of polypeptide subunit release factors